MTFLPIAERELRIAARKRSTFWIRIIAALVACIIGGGIMVLSSIGGLGTASFGPMLFGAVTWLGIAAALSTGLFFTSDCLSEEKREGTLGLLFLTDLRGYDVVLGKLLATSLRGFYALLAVFPILAVTLLMGGVTGAQFWKTALALVNALVYSLAAGLLVSTFSRDSQRAMGGTLFLLVLLLFGAPLADSLFHNLGGISPSPRFSLASPGYVFRAASAWGRTFYWSGLALNQALIWASLALACVFVPRVWQDKAGKTAGRAPIRLYNWKYGGPRWRAALRRKLLTREPVQWLACRERWQSVALWTLALLTTGALALLVLTGAPSEAWTAWHSVNSLFGLGLYLLAATQASRFFVEARRSGLVELLLVSPLSADRIVRGQWRAFWQMFGPPIILFLCVQVVGGALAMEAHGSVAVPAGGFAPQFWVTLISVFVSGIATAANLLALSWFGMWMGMTSKNNNLAALKTLLFVEVIPLFVIYFAAGLVLMLVVTQSAFRGGSNPMMASWINSVVPLIMTLVPAALAVLKDIAFILWARKKLFTSFREQATRSISSPSFAVPPPLPPLPLLPPTPVAR
jgi:hypothetical protein